MKRVIIIVLDSVGVGELPDAAAYGDVGSNTLGSIAANVKGFELPNMERLGLGCITGVSGFRKVEVPVGCFGKMAERSAGKDTTTGHWEIAGIISKSPFPTYPNGFPEEVIREFEKKTGRKALCNLPYSGTEVILEYGREHMETGALIVYTSADSVFQIAAHEEVVPVKELYRYCEIARDMLQGEHGVGRVIARPFVGEYPNYTRTANRHDYSLAPSLTMLDQLADSGLDVLGVGKIYDIFAGKGITDTVRTKSNEEGIEKLIERINREFTGLCFVNLVDFDMVYGHRNDSDGYAKALSYFDSQLPRILEALKDDDILIITADHGCDPSTPSTDHSREYVPMIAYGKRIKRNNDLGTRESFADIAATILEYFNVKQQVAGTSFLKDILKE